MIRPNVIFALKALSLTLIREGCLQEVIFQEECRGEDLYRGGFGKKNNPLDLLQKSEPATNISLVATQKRASSVPEINGTFTIPGPGPRNDRYQMRIRLTGNTLPKPGTFSVIIDWLFGLGLEDSIRKVDEEASRQDPALPVWVFAKQVPSRFILQVSHVLAILEAIARRCVSMNSYRGIEI